MPTVISEGDGELNRSGTLLVARLDKAVASLEEKQAKFAAYLQEIKQKEEEIADLRARLYEAMEEQGVKKLENDHIIVTAIWPTKKHTFDMKKLSATDPVLYKQVDELVGKDTEVRGYAKISLKKQDMDIKRIK